ncbi:U7 snRNA-associated Sm-like protein LSm11 [Anopheles ziemanni]|uniref:U7 snRNA-associated Sm-like protein LSm11 n=1 Tax=Anopheles coustani TaxID=139045 RepID=UPI0026589FDA|nr:U7 snRNA-associated Sm-like protein LSm11 [Anopheles coustani]XP_058166818.1 U7 snRNA-associated Sm-like protein LSm11 [Anopheles ziemanni]
MSENDSDGEIHSSSDSSSELDVSGTRFNPLKALYSTKIKVPVAKAKLHDNVQSLESRQNILGGFDHPYDEQRIKQIRAANTLKKKLPEPSAQPIRRFAPEQGLVQVQRPVRHQRNIFLRLEKGYEGPLAKLQEWMNKRTRVRIYTRKQKGVRGHISGFIEIFDHHWNMAVSDVSETWRRRKYRYSENKLAPETIGPAQDCSERLRMLGIVLPQSKARCDGKKYVICTRKVPQLLILGEQVVLVTPEPPEPEKTDSGELKK